MLLTREKLVGTDWARESLDDLIAIPGKTSVHAYLAAAAYPAKCLECWRTVRESNPCRRREREATYGNSKELKRPWIALYRTLRTHRNAYWTLSGLADVIAA